MKDRQSANSHEYHLKYEADKKVSSINWQNITLVNVHLSSGTNNSEQREEVLRRKIIKHLTAESMIVLEDFNCVSQSTDIRGKAMKNDKRKLSNELKEIVRVWELKNVWIDKNKEVYYTRINARGASRIHRIYYTPNS